MLKNQDINHDWNLGIQTQNVISNPDIRVLVCYVDPQSPIMMMRISVINIKQYSKISIGFIMRSFSQILLK